ncbi:MAG: HlyD family efflux transporter periplasmic adaptor subunit [Gammaproteobacteria bacterium]
MSRYDREPIRPLETFVARDHREALLAALPVSLPSVIRALAGLVALLVIATAGVLWLVPWIQTAAGSGQIVALDPADRVQSINALVEGRINRWHVRDGSIVKAGDPIVEIADIDPRFIERLEAERAALAHRLEAARVATETAKLDYTRQEGLYNEGLSSRKDFESAKIRYQEMLANESSARAALNKADIGVSRQSSQVVRAPQDGRIVHIVAGTTATVVKAGEAIATFAPAHIERAVEVFLSGLDAPLVEAGLPARIMFEGWPAVQFSGWPEAALGTFPGIVLTVDPMAQANGRFRALIREDPSEPWPPDRYLRLGGQARAWVQLSEVRLGYELWRQLNRFPPKPPQPTPASDPGAVAW